MFVFVSFCGNKLCLDVCVDDYDISHPIGRCLSTNAFAVMYVLCLSVRCGRVQCGYSYHYSRACPRRKKCGLAKCVCVGWLCLSINNDACGKQYKGCPTFQMSLLSLLCFWFGLVRL